MKTLAIVAAGILWAGTGSGQTDAITQGEWASYLAEGTGLKQNLPPTATNKDYMRALSQGGFIRKEGEDFWEASAGAATDADRASGPLSQGKWVRAADKPGKVTYRVTIPLEKSYILRSRVRGKEQFWSIDGGDPILVRPKDDLEWETVKDGIDLKPGEHLITVDLPAEGGIDVLEFITSSAPPIAPAGGFAPAAPLTFTEKAETLARALNWEQFLPLDAEPCRIWEAESYSATKGSLEVKKTRDHGTPSDRRWILPPPGESSIVTYYLTVSQEGLYSLKGRFWGDIQDNLSWEIDRNRVSFTPDNPDKFGWITIDTVPLAAGTHRIDMELKSGTGADVFQLVKHRNETGDYLVLLAERGFAEGAFALSVIPRERLAYGRWIEREAEKANRITGDHSLSDDQSHGKPSGERWLSPSGKATARFEFDISEPDEREEKDAEGERSTRIRSEGEKASDLFGPYSFSESTDHGDASEKEWLQAGDDFVTAYFEVDIRREMETAAGPEALLALAAEAERAQKLSGAFAVLTSPDHGEPSGQEWVSATGTAAARFEFDIPSDTLYSIRARDFGPEPLIWKVDPDGADFLLQTTAKTGGKDSFAWHPVGDVFLSAGRHVVEVTLSGGSGLDGWELRKADPCGEEVFVLYSRDFGGRPITWTIDPDRHLPLFRRTVKSPGEKFFDWHPVATISLPAGKHIVSAKLSPESGLDVWEVRRRGWCDENLYALRSRDFGPDPISFRLSPWGKPPILEQTVFPAKEAAFEWNEVATLSIPEGRHVLEVALGENNGFDSWEIRKRTACECEMSALAFAPVTAEAARKNIEEMKKAWRPPEPRPGYSPLPVSTPFYPVLSPFVPEK
jgi:hypothetical protein